MDDDLDIASAMAALFKTVRKINRLITNNALDRNGARRIRNLFQRINDVVSIFDFEEHPLDVTAQKLVHERQEARRNKDWARADEIREELRNMGVDIKDKETI